MVGKTFTPKITGAMLIALLVCSFLGCSSSNDGEDKTPTPDANCESPEKISSVANNHGHTLIVSKADIAASTEKTYTIKGSANHTQYITISPNEFNMLKNNSTISVTSSASEAGIDIMHFHTVLVFCE